MVKRAVISDIHGNIEALEAVLADAQAQGAEKFYCLGDVVQTALLFLRFRLLQGQLSPAHYRQATAALVDALAADTRVGDVLGAVDRDRLLPPAIAPA